MRKAIQCTVLAGVLAVVLLTSCSKTAKKETTEAEENMAAANKDMENAVVADNDEAKAIADWKTFKHESDSLIVDLEKQGKELRQKITKATNREKEKLNNDLTKDEEKLKVEKEKLIKKNTEFEAELKNFNESVVKKNESFKREFNHDIHEIGTAFNDLFKDNVK